MKTKYISLVILITFFCPTIKSATYTINQTQTISVTTGYVDNMNEVWNVVSTVTDKPLIITYSIATENNYDWLTINNVDDSGNVTSQLLRISGAKSGIISTTAPNGRVQVVFTSDGSVCYASSPAAYSGINVTFSVNNNQIVNNGLFVTGNSYVAGKFGVGTINPTQSLSVKGGKIAIQDVGATTSDEGYNGSLMLTKPIASGQYINMIRQGMMPWSMGMVYNSNTFAIGQGTSNDASFTNPFFNITNTGYVGIGTTAPQAGLHVAQPSNINGNSVSAILGSTAFQWTYFGGTTAGRIRGSNEGYLVVGSNPSGTGDKNLYLNYDSPGNIQMALGGGRVGIGTSPTNRLDVAASSGEGIRIGRINDAGNLLVPVNGLSAQYNLDFTGYRDMSTDQIGARISALRFNCHIANSALVQKTGLAFYTNPIGTNTGTTDLIERMRISPEGKVGIGLTDPTYTLSNTPVDELLTVNGTIHAKEVKVDLTGLADFVFKPTYKLMPLHEVEQFVKTNSHLPEIPSAAEVEKNGLSMGEMQNKLLQKIEELTLYVIEQQKQIDELKRQQKQ